MIWQKNKATIAAVMMLLCTACAATRMPIAPSQAAVASAHPLATAAGLDMLAAGGNAFDAAVAVTAVLAVVEPAGSGLGGGGFWLLHEAESGKQTMIDGREKAPLAATRDMYLDAAGDITPRASVDGALAAGIPGLPAAMAHLAEQYGRLPLATSLASAIRYATTGFAIGKRHHKLSIMRQSALQASPAAAAVFLQQGKPLPVGAILKQPDLANTLTALARRGHAGFYAGEVAAKLVRGTRAAGGIWTAEDLAAYKVIERTPITGEYRGIKITSAAPPSSGGVVLMETLNILAGYDLSTLAAADKAHLIIEAMRRSYHDRARYLGDTDFVVAPLARLVSADYAATRRATINPAHATPSTVLAATQAPQAGGEDTTHFSILDKAGNRVAATLSVNYPFGSGFMPPGTGVILNDEMDDFVTKAGAPNVYGLVGGTANEISGGKRMLSSMSPTFIEDAHRIAILGTPGGSRIISMVLLAILDFAEGNDAASWVSLPRFHHQYLPDVVQFEQGGLTAAMQTALTARGHTLREMNRRYGDMHAVLWDKTTGNVTAASDPRGEGAAVVK